MISLAHFHFQTVHFPIAFTLGSLFILGLGFTCLKNEKLLYAGRTLLYLAALGALVAMGTGLLAEENIPHHHEGDSHQVMETHKTLGIVIACGLSFISLISLWAEKKKKWTLRKIVLILLLALTGFVGYTGYLGGRLGHEFGIGIEEKHN